MKTTKRFVQSIVFAIGALTVSACNFPGLWTCLLQMPEATTAAMPMLADAALETPMRDGGLDAR